MIAETEVRLARAGYTLQSAFGSVQPRETTEDFDKMIREAMEEHAEEIVREMNEQD